MDDGKILERSVAAPSKPTEAGQWVVSPCTGVCILHPESKFCLGCYRGIDEIARWRDMSAAQRHAIMAELPHRRAADRV